MEKERLLSFLREKQKAEEYGKNRKFYPFVSFSSFFLSVCFPLYGTYNSPHRHDNRRAVKNSPLVKWHLKYCRKLRKSNYIHSFLQSIISSPHNLFYLIVK